MSELSPDLLAAAGWCLVACWLLLLRPLGPGLALVVATAKIALPLAHFRLGLFDIAAWRLLDDVKYVEEAASLRGALLGGAPDAASQLFDVAEGHHVGYYVWNVLAQTLFGEHYFAAVFLNVVLTCVAARGVLRLLELVGLARGYALAFAVFFLLHWDVLAWSSFFNMKDPVVMTLSVWLFVWGLELVLKARPQALVGFLAIAGILYFFRWYVPVLVTGALGLWGVSHLRGWRRNVLLLLGLAVLVAIPLHGRFPRELLQPTGLFAGFFKFAMTPRPWGMSEGYRFLLLPSALHWFLAPLALLGGLNLWRRYPRARPLLLYVLLVFCFYAMVPRLHGPRHRFQCVFVLAWLQFHGLYGGLRQAFGHAPARWRPSARALGAWR